MKIFKYRVLNHILFWIFIYAFYTFPSAFASESVHIRYFTLNLLYLPIDIITVYIVIEYIIPKYIFKKKNFLVFIIGFITAIVFNVFVSRIVKYQIQPIFGFWVNPRPLSMDLFYSLWSNFMIVGLAVALKFMRHSFNISLVQSEMERRSTLSELGILRSQVNPHFLFNTLNNIDALIFEDAEKASNGIFLLSKIMRFMLHESNQEKVQLDKEISYIQDYLELAKLSFEDPDFMEFEINGGIKNKLVPPLLFIPIIENTIKHSNKQSPSPGIKIEFEITDTSIELNTCNHIKRSDFKLPEEGKHKGTGIKNVERRLKLLYPGNYIFTVTPDDDMFKVYLKVPLL